MKIKDYKCTCGNNNFFIADKGNQKGIYCSYCGKWFKWADKNEQNLAMMTESIPMSVMDEIKSEIHDEAEFAYADFDRYKEETLYVESDELPDDDFRYGLERAFEIINRKVKEYKDGCSKDN